MKKIQKLMKIFSCIFRAAIYSISSKFEMYPEFIIKNNFCQLNTSINIEKNCLIEKTIHNSIIGGHIYFNNSDVNIKGGLIQNGKNNLNISQNIYNKEILEKKKKIALECQGGGIKFINCKNIVINKLRIDKCNANKGGGIYFQNCKGIISNSIFENNFAKTLGEAIAIAGNNSDFKLIN